MLSITQSVPATAGIESEMEMDMNMSNDSNSQKACAACNIPRNVPRKRAGSALASKNNLLLSLVLLMVQFCGQVQAGWGNSNSNSDASYSIYGNANTRDWLYDGSTLSFEVLGCVWGVVYDSEEAGCLEDESEDGTYNWYMMANCRRPQVAYSVYASDSGSSTCSSSTFVGSVSICFCCERTVYYCITGDNDVGITFDLFTSSKSAVATLHYDFSMWFLFQAFNFLTLDNCRIFFCVRVLLPSVYDNNGSFRIHKQSRELRSKLRIRR